MPQNSFHPGSDIQTEFEKYKSDDPFTQIAPGLLNSADIADYAVTTKMIHPFDKDKMKPTTYGLHLLGKVIYWDENKKRQVQDIKFNEKFVLKSNSIAFVSVQEELRLPFYIVARFNLKINHIYKGILLGTGPVVDAGFQGKLSIPLHNLTNNDYEFLGGEILVWMEFTKTTPNPKWNLGKALARTGQYVPYQMTGREDRDVEDFLKDAYHGSIESSLPSITKRNDELYLDIKKEKEKVTDSMSKLNWLTGFSFVAILSMTATIINILYTDLREVKAKAESTSKVNDSRFKTDSVEMLLLKNQVYDLQQKTKVRKIPTNDSNK